MTKKLPLWVKTSQKEASMEDIDVVLMQARAIVGFAKVHLRTLTGGDHTALLNAIMYLEGNLTLYNQTALDREALEERRHMIESACDTIKNLMKGQSHE
jgi:hypothetical protein